MVKVTLIVAVYNPGANIDELLASIDEQSLPHDEFEVIFADDDSTDGTRDRLREWAVTRPHVRVLHNTPNSGWPGRPRNLAIDQATGEFLFFADNDDKLAPRALEWMYDYAREHGSDVVIAKEVGVGPGRSVPRHLFRRNIPDAKLGKDPILGILTPHKLVRTAMVREHGIRFPEGRVRLEDHLFVVSCYFAARRISVLADRLCYYWMRRVGDGDNASMNPVDPAMYYRSVEAVLEVVEANTEPGRLRDQMYAHWYNTKMLARLRGGSLLVKEPDYQESLHRELLRVSRRFELGEAQWPWLGAGARLRSHLLNHGTLDQLRLVGTAERGVTSRIVVDDVAWTDEETIRIRLHAHLVYADGGPVRVVREKGAVYWDTDHLLPGLDLPRIDITDQKVGLSVLISDRSTLELTYAPGRSERIDGDQIAARTEVTLNARQLTDTYPDGAVLDLRGRLVGAGWASEYRLPVADQQLPEARLIAGMTVWPYGTQGHGNLSIAVRQPKENAGLEAAAPPALTPRRGRSVVGSAPVQHLWRRLPESVRARLRAPARRVLGPRARR